MTLTAKPYLRNISIHPDAQPDLFRYPFNIAAVHAIDALSFHADVTFFVGENGSGKSTILEAIAVAMGLPAEGGTRNVLRQQQQVSALHACLQLAKSFRAPRSSYFLRAESLFNVISYIDSLDEDEPPPRTSLHPPPPPRTSLHLRSHGEAFMELLLGFRSDGLYLLDEPEAALSPNRQLAALSAIDQLVRRGSQFIIATHSPILLAYPNAKILQFDGSGISEVAYEDTEHYAITRDFLNHHQRRLEQLLADDEEPE